jgi:hypothetical protein
MPTRGPRFPGLAIAFSAGLASLAPLSAKPAFTRSIHDQRVPDTDGASLTIHVEAGRRERDFHVTCGRAGAYYLYFDGTAWSAPLPITTEHPFRSGVHIAVGHDNAAHLAWVEGRGDRDGTLRYRTVRAGRLGATETVHTPLGWNECDIAIDSAGRPLIAANTTTQKQLALYERGDADWKRTVLPSDNELGKWAPAIVTAAEGLVYVALRRKDRHPFTWQVRDGGVWTKDTATPWRSYEPNAIPHGAGLIAASMDGFVYRVEKQAGKFVVSHHDVRATKRGIIRGQHVGIGLTRGGVLILSHGDMANEPSTDRTIRAHHRFYYSFAHDDGRTWTFNQPVAAESGQGHGNMAVNGTWVMLVWPDIRGGAHLRHSLLREQTSSAAVVR